MKRPFFLMLMAIGLCLTGCKTLEKDTEQISWEQQRAYMKKVQDPRVYGMGIYDTPSGLQIRGGGRVHPDQAEMLEMLAEEPIRPLVDLTGKFDQQWPVLLDFTSMATWSEFEIASSLGARPVGEQKAQLVHLSGDEIPACLSTFSALRLGQIFVEYPLVYVRMATGSLGPLSRNVSEGPVHAVVGWDILKKFHRIQFLYPLAQLVLSTIDEEYEANPERLLAELSLVKHAGACAVRGEVNGVQSLILIDPAGDFEVAANGPVSSLKLGAKLELSAPATVPSPGGVRVGAKWLQNYQVTICPKAGRIWLEKPIELEP